MSTFAINVTEEEANKILNGLAQRPYIEVYQLITNLQQQVQTQIDSKNNTTVVTPSVDVQ